MRSRKAKWLSGLGAVVLIGISVLAMAEPWSHNMPSSGRFQGLANFQNQAVLDKNTGLVWERAPDTFGQYQWVSATITCAVKQVSGTVGWRLPSVIELKSVQDPSLAPPFVPASVFPNVQSTLYWSATTVDGYPGNAWVVNFFNGNVQSDHGKPESAQVWCVRGPMQESVY